MSPCEEQDESEESAPERSRVLHRIPSILPPAAVSKKTKITKASMPNAKAAGKSRAEGVRLFQIAGRPSKQDFITVFGPNGPKLTWDQRAAAGVPANKFQAALAAKQSGRKDTKPSIPAPTVKD
jgi:hypothetical protein